MKTGNTGITAFVFFLLPMLFCGMTFAGQSELFLQPPQGPQTKIYVEPEVLRYRPVAVDLDLLCVLENRAADPAYAPQENSLYLNLFDDVYLEAVIHKTEPTFSGGVSLTGSIDGYPSSQFILVKTAGIVSANISVNREFYQVRFVSPGLHCVQEIDQRQFPLEAPPIRVNPAGIRQREPVEQEHTASILDSGKYIDVLVVYTEAARDVVGGTSAMENLIDTAISETNSGYSNSGVTQRLRLVHTAKVDFNETLVTWSNILGRLQTTNDNYIDNVHTLRGQYGADEVVLIIKKTGYCGIGYLMDTVSPAFDDWAFAVVAYNCATGYYSFAHELGHNMGCHHDRDNTTSSGAYSYSHGYQAPDESFRTIMAYDCDGGCTRVNYWSNPDKTYGGLPMGVSSSSASSADNRKTLNNTLSTVRNFRQGVSNESITVTAPNGGESLAAESATKVKWTSTGSISTVKIEYSTNNGGSWKTVTSSTNNDGSYNWTVPDVSSSQCLVQISNTSGGDPSDTSDGVFSIIGDDTPVISLNRSPFYFGAVRNGSSTGAQTLLVENSGGGTLSWTAASDSAWLSASPGSGSGTGEISLSVNATGLSSGTFTGTVTVSDGIALNSPQTLSVILTVKNASQDELPQGEFATPTDGENYRSSIAVTGWVVDDIEVSNVQIFNGNDYVGDAVFVEGARDDIAQSYPTYPKSYQAGWGYMLLSNFLPNGGNGTYTLYAKAVDSSGQTKVLGSKRITIDNANAVNPFGAIDAPAQGGTTSGSSFTMSGWVLTPLPNTVPTDGSTIEVYIDYQKAGTTGYNQYRSDIAGFFPGYNNSDGAWAYATLDTTAYDNGNHVLYWIATDDDGNSAGIGSRFFTIRNTGTGAAPQAAPFEGITSPEQLPEEMRGILERDRSSLWPKHSAPVGLVKGLLRKPVPSFHTPDRKGVAHLETGVAEPLAIYLNGTSGTVLPSEKIRFHGFREFNGMLKPLPAGSRLDRKKGVFYWYPAPGFLGNYNLVFFDMTKKRLHKVNINILP